MLRIVKNVSISLIHGIIHIVNMNKVVIISKIIINILIIILLWLSFIK